MSNFYADEGTAAHTVFERCMRNAKMSADSLVGKTLVTHSERTHNPYAPSASKRWLTCPASIQHIEQNSLIGDSVKEDVCQPIEVTDEMADAVQVAVDYARGVLTGKDWILMVEAEVQIPATKQKGHVDLAAYNKRKNVLHVFDYKHGAGILVNAEKNSQMQLYTLGILDYLSEYTNEDTQITLHIMQPRCTRRKNPIDTWETSYKELMAFDKYVRQRIKLSKSDDPPYVVSDECRWCAKETCAAFADKALSVAHQDFNEFVSKPAKAKKARTLSNKQISVALSNMHILVDFIKSLPAEAKRRIEAGQKIDNWVIANGRAQRQWKKDFPAAELARMGFDIDDYQPRSTISMTAVEKMLPAPRREKFMAKHTKLVDGKPQLMPAHKATSAKDDFAEDLW